MPSELRDFLEISYAQLEEMNLEAKQARNDRIPADKLREHFATLGTHRTQAQHVEYLSNHAKQERAMAATQGIKLN